MMLARAQNDMQMALGDHYLDLAPAELRSVSKGQLLAHADSDVEVAVGMVPLVVTLNRFNATIATCSALPPVGR